MIECGNFPKKPDKLDTLIDRISVESFRIYAEKDRQNGDCDGCEKCAGYCANCNRRKK